MIFDSRLLEAPAFPEDPTESAKFHRLEFAADPRVVTAVEQRRGL
jgi:hypothetical protein